MMSGCGRQERASAGQEKGPSGQPQAAAVVVSRPVVREITDYEDYPGRTEAVKTVEVRARVTGYLEKSFLRDPANRVNREGKEFAEGEVLFLIDPRIYDAELKRAEGTLQQAKAHLARLELDYKRAVPLLPSQAISREDYDKIVGDRQEAQAAVTMAEAARALAQLNVNFTKVTAPFAGRVSRQLIDPGNLVKADETVLTTIVALDPIYVYFDVDERSVLKFRRLMEEGKVKSARDSVAPVWMGLVDEVEEDGTPRFPHEGTINFVDNRIDPMTGTLRLRGVFPNAKRLLSPGLFARVRVPIGKPHPAILVPEEALGTDQGQSFVYVVTDDNHARKRYVKVGPPEEGRLRVIESGLARSERVIQKGLQRVRDGDPVTPQEEAIPGAPSKPPAAGPNSAPGAGGFSPGTAKS
jgi:RND family efflux transporter MFP subunit